MVDGFPVNIDKSQAVTSPATEKIFKADRSKPLNNCKAGFFIQLWLEVFLVKKSKTGPSYQYFGFMLESKTDLFHTNISTFLSLSDM